VRYGQICKPNHKWLEQDSPRLLWLEQSRFGSGHDGTSVKVSLCSWRSGTTPEHRDHNVWTEREELAYMAAHFNRANGSEQFENRMFGCVSKTYVDDIDGTSSIYSTPSLRRCYSTHGYSSTPAQGNLRLVITGLPDSAW
jgi:hypothetical protein